MASVPESRVQILFILLAFSKLENEGGKKSMPLLRSKVIYPVPEPCILGSGSTWCEPSQLGRAGLVNSADEGHHLYTLLLPVVKAVSLGISKGTLETEACSLAHPPHWPPDPSPLCAQLFLPGFQSRRSGCLSSPKSAPSCRRHRGRDYEKSGKYGRAGYGGPYL